MTPLAPSAAAVNAALSDEDVKWLQDLPFIVEAAGWVAVHGGFLPGQTPRDQVKNGRGRSGVLRVRWVNGEGQHVPVVYDEDWELPADAQHWAERWDQPFNVVYGHEAHSLSRPHETVAPSGARVVGIDTGVVHGGRLTAMVVEDDGGTSFVQVQAECGHARPPFGEIPA